MQKYRKCIKKCLNHMRKYTGYFLIILVLLCLYFVQQSYAKYISSASEETIMHIARWKIKVNNQDIRNNSSLNATINPVFPGNENIASNIIAPTAEGYFDLVIDARETDVSFKYTINIETAPDSSVTDLIATKYTINSGEEILFENSQVIENTVSHTDNTNLINIRVYIKWDDGENSTMDNHDDTLATTSNLPPKMKISMNLIQVV